MPLELTAEDLEVINETETKTVLNLSKHLSKSSESLATSVPPKLAEAPSFSTLGIDKWLQKALLELSIKNPTDIQTNTIPHILAGKDCIGSAKTGSGKTAAFALPILQKLSQDPFGVFALVLTPTRELAFQIAEQFRVLSGSGINLKLEVIVGGLDMSQQAISLAKKPHIIVATPGRLRDHIQSSHDAVDLNRLRFLASNAFNGQVLDEADRLLSNSFGNDLAVILDTVPSKRQTLLFTATMTQAIEQLQFAGSKPIVYRGNERYDTVEKLDQRFLLVPYVVKDANLVYLLKQVYNMGAEPERPAKKARKLAPVQKTSKPSTSIIIFTGKWKTCERLYLTLRELGIRCTALHSHISQNERLASIAKFKSNLIPVLVTTDVGSRGLDIPTVEVVINYDLPADATDYIHRVGRTARASRSGMALSIICERDVDVLLNIEEAMGKKLVEYEGIEESKVLEMMDDVSIAKRMASSAMTGEETKSKYARKLRN